MKKRFKFLLLVLAVAMTFSFVTACGNDAANTTAASDESTNAPSEQELTTPDEAAVAPVQNNLILATDTKYPPFVYEDGADHAGIDVELAEAIAEHLGLSLSVVHTDYSSLLEGVAMGEYDIGMAAIPENSSMADRLALTNPYAKGRLVALCTSETTVLSKDDLNSARIGFPEGRSGEAYLNDNFPKAKAEAFVDMEAAVTALKNGELDCVLTDEATAFTYSASDGQLTLTEIESEEIPYVICTEKGNSELVMDINEALLELEESGFTAGLFEKYNMPVSAE